MVFCRLIWFVHFLLHDNIISSCHQRENNIIAPALPSSASIASELTPLHKKKRLLIEKINFFMLHKAYPSANFHMLEYHQSRPTKAFEPMMEFCLSFTNIYGSFDKPNHMISHSYTSSLVSSEVCIHSHV